ncbi:MAG: DUF2065 domain-containing protein [Thermodesulfobacteriota bacterium]
MMARNLAERFSLKTLIALVGLVLIFEGLPYAAFPEAMQNWLRQLAEVKPGSLRKIGWIAVLLGLGLCYLSQRSGILG